MPNVRIPLLTSIEFRSSDDTSKDGVVVNGFMEQDGDNLYTYKRPGKILKVSGAGAAKGIFYYNGKLYSWDSTTSNTSPVQTVM